MKTVLSIKAQQKACNRAELSLVLFRWLNAMESQTQHNPTCSFILLTVELAGRKPDPIMLLSTHVNTSTGLVDQADCI